jgi:hypothetical protein
MLETTRTYTRASLAIADDGQAPAGLNAAVRSLFARLSSGAAEAPARPARSVRAVWETDHGRRPLDRDTDPEEAEPDEAGTRRTQAHAAFRIVQGAEQAAVDAAIGVVEAEVTRLRRTVLAYGEALKAIQVYGPDEETRKTAAAALRRAPERLRAAPPVPQLDRSSTGGEHG